MEQLLAAGFYIGSVQITYYAIMICIGMILGTIGTAWLFSKRNISWDLVIDLFVIVIPCAIIGARVYFCTVLEMTKNGSMIPIGEWFNFKDGGLQGLSIIGGVILGTVGVVLVCLIKKVNFWRIGDCIAPCLLLGQVIGRWGNFFNNEVYGMVIDNPSWQWFPFAVDIGGTYHLALFFIEGVLNLIGCVVMVVLLLKFKKKPNGLFVCGYFIYYGIVRSCLEPLRDNSFKYQSSFWSSIVFLAVGLLVLAFLLYRNYKKEGALIGSRVGEPLVIYPRIDNYAADRVREKEEKELKHAQRQAKKAGVEFDLEAYQREKLAAKQAAACENEPEGESIASGANSDDGKQADEADEAEGTDDKA